MKKYNSIVLTGGGTMGHISPNLAIIPELYKTFDNISYIGSKTGLEKSKITELNKKLINQNKRVDFYDITTCKLNRTNIFKNILLPFKLFAGIKQAKKLLININPDVVFSKGGFVSVPVVFAAHKLKIPIVSHESDLSIGLANKVTSKYCSTVCTTFPETAKKTVNGKYTGSPINQNIFNGDAEKIKKKYNLFPHQKTILITGGSLGSTTINKAILKLLPSLTLKYNVLHLTGKNKKIPFKHINYHQEEFTNDIGSFIKASDLVISRAGSNTIFELASLKKPMLLIPLSKTASRGDQIDNANYFKKLGIAEVVLEEDIDIDLERKIDGMLKNCSAIKRELNKLNFPNGKQNIINEIYKAIEKTPELKNIKTVTKTNKKSA